MGNAENGSFKRFLVHGLTTPFRWVARFQAWVAATVQRIPGWPDIEAAATQVTWPLRATAAWSLERMPWLHRVEWLMETKRLATYPPVMLAGTILFMFYRGLSTTNLGHIGTDLLIYPTLAMVSGFNPFLGCFSALCFATGDLIQKLLINDIYGTPQDWLGHYFDLDYWGAVFGYVFAHLAPLSMGLLPGITSRMSRQATRLALRRVFYTRAAAAADGARPGGADDNWQLFSRRRSDGTTEWTTAPTAPPGHDWVPEGSPITRDEAEATVEGLRRGELSPAPQAMVDDFGRNAPLTPSRAVADDFGRGDAPRKPQAIADDFGRGKAHPPAAEPPLPPGMIGGGRRADGSRIVGMAAAVPTPETRPARPPASPYAPNYKDPATQAALRGLQEKSLLNDPDAWRAYRDENGQPLNWREKQILGNLRGRRLLNEGNDAAIARLLGGAPIDRVGAGGGGGEEAGSPAYRDDQGGPVYPAAEFIAAMAGGIFATGVVMRAIAPMFEMIGFYSRPHPDITCFRLERDRYLHGRTASVGFTGGGGGPVAEVLGKPIGGGGGAPTLAAMLPPQTPGATAPPPPPTKEQEKNWIDRWNAVDPNLLLGNPQLQDEYRNIMDRYRSSGRIDEQALSDFERKVGKAGADYWEKWNKDTADAVERSGKLIAETDDKARDEFYRQRDLGNKLAKTLDRIAKGDLASAGGLDLASTPDVYVDGKPGVIDENKLNDFITRATNARKDLAQQQRDDAIAKRGVEERWENIFGGAEWVATKTRNISFTAVGAIMTGGAGAAAGGGLLGALTGANVGIGWGFLSGGIRAASDAGKFDGDKMFRGAMGGAAGGLIGGLVGGVIGGVAHASGTNAVTTFIANNPITTGAIFGGAGAAVTGGNILEGAIEGAVGGKFADVAGRTVGSSSGWHSGPVKWTKPPAPTVNVKTDEVTSGYPEDSPPPPVGFGSANKTGPRVGHDRPAEPWMGPPERGGGPKPQPTKIKGVDVEPPPDREQPWFKRLRTDPVTGKTTKGPVPEGAPEPEPYDPDALPWNKKEGLPRGHEGRGATPGKKYPGGVGDDEGKLTPFGDQSRKAAAREAEIERLAKQPEKELGKQLTDAEVVKGDQDEAAMVREALKRKRGESKAPEPLTPEDPSIRQAEVEKLKGLSRKELEAREAIANAEGDKKQADLVREALNRHKEPPSPRAPLDHDRAVKDLSNMDLEDLQGARDAARARGNEAEAQLYDDAMNKQLADIKQRALDARKNITPEELAKSHTLEELRNQERALRAEGDEAAANKLAEAYKRKLRLDEDVHAKLDQKEKELGEAVARRKVEKAAEAAMTPEERAAKAAAEDQLRREAEAAARQKKLDDLFAQMEKAKAGAAAQKAAAANPDVDLSADTAGKIPRPAAKPDVDLSADTAGKIPRPAAKPDVDLGAETAGKIQRPAAQPDVDLGADTAGKIQRPAAQPDVDLGAETAGKLPRPKPDPTPVSDYDGLSNEQLKSMQEMAKSSGDTGEADAIGKVLDQRGVKPPLHPKRPDDVKLPWEKDDASSTGTTPDPSKPTAKPPAPEPVKAPEPPPGVHPDDLPPSGEALTDDQLKNLRTKYSDEQLLVARDQARVNRDKYMERQLEYALDERGYHAPPDEKLLTPPPPGELPDFTQVEALADKYTTRQLDEFQAAAKARGDNRMWEILQLAKAQKRGDV